MKLPDVTEQLGFEQRIGKTRAVDGHELVRPPGAAFVNQARDQLLADAALTGDEDLGAAARGDVDFPLNRAHGSTGAQHDG